MTTSDVDLLDEVLSGARARDEAPASVASLATLASTLSVEIAAGRAPEDVRYRLRDGLLAAMAEPASPMERARDRVDRWTASWRHSVRVAVASAVASTMIGTTGVAAAAQAALPGDVLYGVKTFTEDARLAFAAGDVDEGRLHLAFARERLEEVEDGVERLSADQLRSALADFDEEAAAGSNRLLTAAGAEGDLADELLAELATFTEEQAARLLAVRDLLPLSAVTAAETSREVLRRIDTQVDALLGPACAACGAAVSARGGGARPGDRAPVPLVVLPSDGPAAPGTGCNCVGDAPADPSVPRESPTEGVSPAVPEAPSPSTPSEPAVPSEPTPEAVPSDEGLSGQIGELVEPLGGLGDLVDDLLEDTGLDGTVDDLGETVDDLTDPTPGGGVDGLLDDLLGG